MLMNTKVLTVRFLTPAFLGDAEQHGTWRTPPFKAQLRQWWRLVLADRGCDLAQIRSDEAELFGNAGESARKSQVRLRLDKWGADSKRIWSGNQIQRNQANGNMDALIYLGYGRVDRNSQSKPSIDAGETAELRIAWPTGAAAKGADRIEAALALMSRFGTIGGRSRNGWGSYVLNGVNDATWIDYLIDWHEALESDWVRGIGRDERGPLIWRTRGSWTSWNEALQQLASVRATITKESKDRCLLSYPVTRYSLPGWNVRERLPNSLRFKVVEDTDGRLRGEVFHLPCRPSDELWSKWGESGETGKKRRLTNVWADAHEYLDEENALERLSA